jgi:acyl-CoA synthetase (AMP-forming)/AMP-acid ligase II
MSEEEEILPPGETGEIAVQGANVFRGYALHASEGKKRFVSGFFKTGDIGFQDSEGLFFYCRREKPLIIRGGVNIHPSEVDEVLCRHPAVAQAITTGVPNDFFGEEIQSTVELLPPYTVSESDLKAHCRRVLSPLKVPDLICIKERLGSEKGKAG